jgi:hypothetical protein
MRSWERNLPGGGSCAVAPCEDCAGEACDIGDELALCPECRAIRQAEEAEAMADSLEGR